MGSKKSRFTDQFSQFLFLPGEWRKKTEKHRDKNYISIKPALFPRGGTYQFPKAKLCFADSIWGYQCSSVGPFGRQDDAGKLGLRTQKASHRTSQEGPWLHTGWSQQEAKEEFIGRVESEQIR